MPYDNFNLRLDRYRHELNVFLSTSKSIFLLEGMRGNTGDHLIWDGTRRLLSQIGASYKGISVSDISQYGLAEPHGTLVIPGSGAFTESFNEWLPDLVNAAANRFERVLILPSQFETRVESVRRALSNPNVFPIARDFQSFSEIRSFGRSGLAPDPALYAIDIEAPIRLPLESRSEPSELLICWRTDVDSSLTHLGLLASKDNEDLSTVSLNINQFLERIQASGIIFTDRLHVLVAAVLLGKQVHYLDSKNRKISNYIEFNFESDFVELVRPANPSELLRQRIVREI